jgi:peptidoglycan/xylan/chitin deacetylase (PgdA/CDA1 family)
MIRCDDIFVDSDVNNFEKICQLIRRYEFHHIIGITPLGEGKKLSTKSGTFWKIHFLTKYGFFINYRIKKLTGEKYIGDNTQLVELLNLEFSKYGAVPALHGLHHYRYTNMSLQNVYGELFSGTELLKELFDKEVEVFIPPFNAWNYKTESVCKKMNLSIDKCRIGFDKLIKNMNYAQIEMLAKLQAKEPEIYYHPHRLVDLEKFDLYLRIRRKYC